MRDVGGRLFVAWASVLAAASVVALRTPAEAERPIAPPPAVPVVRQVAPPPRVVEPPKDRWALVVGIADYHGRMTDTVGGANDARAVRKALLANGWRADRIKMLVDDQATGTAVRAGLRWLVSKSSSDGFSFFHYSGHVKQRGGREYLWPVDSKLIVDTDVAKLLRPLRGYAWLDFAGCEAAGFDEGLSSPRRLVTGSSQVYEKSFEDPAWGESIWSGVVFTRGFLRREADANHDGRVTIGEAVRYGVRFAPVLTKDQPLYGYPPQHPYVAGGDGHDSWPLTGPS